MCGTAANHDRGIAGENPVKRLPMFLARLTKTIRSPLSPSLGSRRPILSRNYAARSLSSFQHFRTNDVQKGEILALITSTGRSALWIMGLSWIALCLLLTAESLLWAHRLGYQASGLSAVLVVIVITFSVYTAVLASRR